MTGQILTADSMSRNVSYSFYIFQKQSINLSHNLFLLSCNRLLFYMNYSRLHAEMTQENRSPYGKHVICFCMSCRGWGGGISSLTLVFKLFWWNFPQAVCQDYRWLPFSPSFPYVFQFHFRQLWKFSLQNTSAYTCQKARRFFFEAWTFKPSELTRKWESNDFAESLFNQRSTLHQVRSVEEFTRDVIWCKVATASFCFLSDLVRTRFFSREFTLSTR